MTTKRIGKDFTAAHDNAMAWGMHRRGMDLRSAFRAVNFAKQESRCQNAHFLRKSLGLRPQL